MEAAMKGQKRYLSCCYLRFCAYSATITDMNFRIRIFNFCTSNCTPYLITLYFLNALTPFFVGFVGLMVPSALNSILSMHTSR